MPQLPPHRRAPAAAMLAAAAVAPALAGDPAPLTLGDPLAKVSFSLALESSFTTESDLSDSGSVSVARLGPSLGVRYAPAETSFIDVNFGAEYSFYEFDDATGIVPGGDPADDFAEYVLGARYTGRVNEQWWWFVGGNASWAAEDGASLGDGFTASGMLGATYAINPRLSIGAGLVVRSRIEDDALVYGLPVINWKINDQWTLETVSNALRLSYAPSEDWAVYVAGGWESREFRLSEDGPIPDGVMRDDRIPIVLGAILRPGENIEFDIAAGSAVWGQYEFRDTTGAEIADADADPALLAMITARLRF
ncbi:MAG TPA: hypothetical protein VFF69_08650 [Phycisphaerales bacterium]|nr:hypothetical protein [Phycisphaerales bacterium]